MSAAGHVLRWDGATWKVETIAPAGLQSVWGSSATHLWVAGDDGLVLHGTVTPEKVTFEPVNSDTSQTITRIWGRSATDVWAISDRVYHLEAEGNDPPRFVQVDVPNAYDDPNAYVQYSSVWGNATGVWVGGERTTFCIPRTAATELSFRREVDGLQCMGACRAAHSVRDHGHSGHDHERRARAGRSQELWRQRPGGANCKPSGRSRTDLARRRGIVSDGPYAWTQELAETYGAPEGLWANASNDIWLVGAAGVVRHYDGTKWELARTALTPRLPLLNDLHSVHAVTSSSGEQDIWIVGDNVALHRTVKP